MSVIEARNVVAERVTGAPMLDNGFCRQYVIKLTNAFKERRAINPCVEVKHVGGNGVLIKDDIEKCKMCELPLHIHFDRININD